MVPSCSRLPPLSNVAKCEPIRQIAAELFAVKVGPSSRQLFSTFRLTSFLAFSWPIFDIFPAHRTCSEGVLFAPISRSLKFQNISRSGEAEKVEK